MMTPSPEQLYHTPPRDTTQYDTMCKTQYDVVQSSTISLVHLGMSRVDVGGRALDLDITI